MLIPLERLNFLLTEAYRVEGGVKCIESTVLKTLLESEERKLCALVKPPKEYD